MITERRRTILAGLIAVAVLAVAGVVAFVLLLGQGARPGSALPMPTPTPTQTPATPASPTSPSTASTSPTPSAAVETRGEMLLVAEGFVLRSGDDESFTFRWSDDPEAAVSALTAAIGSEPVERIRSTGQTHFPDYAVWSWPGLDFSSMVDTPGDAPPDQYVGAASVAITANSVGDVDVSAEFGLTIGMSVDEARAAGPDDEFPPRSGKGPRFIFARDRSEMPPDAARHPERLSVVAETSADDAVAKIVYGYVVDF